MQQKRWKPQEHLELCQQEDDPEQIDIHSEETVIWAKLLNEYELLGVAADVVEAVEEEVLDTE